MLNQMDTIPLLKRLFLLIPIFSAACMADELPPPSRVGTTSPSAEPASTPTPHPTPFTLSGSGSTFTEAFSLIGGTTLINVDSPDTSCYARLLKANGDLVSSFSRNTISTYDGMRLARLPRGDYRFEVRSNASWSISVTQPDNPAAPELTEVSGEGDKLLGPYRFSHGLNPYLASHARTSRFHFTVYEVDGFPRNFFIGRTNLATESVSLINRAGVYYLGIRCQGPWSLTKQTL